MKINWGILSKYKSELYGFSILWIMISHCPYLLKIDTGDVVNYIIAFFRYGNCGVDVFLFLSGICLFFSMKQHDDIKEFFYKRCYRIFLPLFVIDGFYWFYDCVLIRHNVILFLNKITLLDFWLHGRQQVWFIALLLPLYFFYPFIYKSLLLKSKPDYKIRWLVLLILFTIIYSIAIFWRFYYAKQYNGKRKIKYRLSSSAELCHT